jgi:hypothetical protein
MKLTRSFSFKRLTPYSITARAWGEIYEGRKSYPIQRVAVGLNDSLSVVRLFVVGAGSAK